MNAGKTLFPMMMLALLGGCSPPSSDQVRAGERQREGAALTPPASHSGRSTVAEAVPATTEKAAPKPGPGTKEATTTLLQPIDPAAIVHVSPPFQVPDLPPGDGISTPTPFPDEVTRYMVDRDSCDHFRGEEAYDQERLAFLQENIAELCTGTDARLAVLRQRYAQDPTVMSALGNYEDRIEGNASQ